MPHRQVDQWQGINFSISQVTINVDANPRRDPEFREAVTGHLRRSHEGFQAAVDAANSKPNNAPVSPNLDCVRYARY
jgi:hypothetical protein